MGSDRGTELVYTMAGLSLSIAITVAILMAVVYLAGLTDANMNSESSEPDSIAETSINEEDLAWYDGLWSNGIERVADEVEYLTSDEIEELEEFGINYTDIPEYAISIYDSIDNCECESVYEFLESDDFVENIIDYNSEELAEAQKESYLAAFIINDSDIMILAYGNVEGSDDNSRCLVLMNIDEYINNYDTEDETECIVIESIETSDSFLRMQIINSELTYNYGKDDEIVVEQTEDE